MPRCQAAGVPEERREYRSKTELALGDGGAGVGPGGIWKSPLGGWG